jgi:type II secretory pathway predicted ATPase ExeA
MSAEILKMHKSPAALLEAAAAFREMRDPSAMYLGPVHLRALEGLMRLASCGQSGVGLVTGAPGLGKTLLRNALHRQAAEEHCAVVAIETGLLGFDDLLLEILSQLRGQRAMPSEFPTRYERLAALKSLLVSHVIPNGRHLLLLCDEADQLDAAALEAIGTLTNICSERQTFVVPIFFGLPTLHQKLAQIPALRQRVGSHFSIGPMDAAECRTYIEHRLRHAGVDPALVLEATFAPRVHAASGGVPRVINSICRHALRYAADHGAPRASAACVDACQGMLLDVGAIGSSVFLGQ